MIISYNWLKWYVPELPDVETLKEAIIAHAFEVESVEKIGDDFALDIKTLPDRNHDCLSHMGIAHEVCAILNLKYNDPTSAYKIPDSHPTKLSVTLESTVARRYMGRIVRGVKVGPSPDWMVTHLASIGQRSINNIVDATNIVLFNCGQPCHAFDVRKIKNEHIVVRKAREMTTDLIAEGLFLLGSNELKDDPCIVNQRDTVISDEDGNALAVAGVKGGKYAEIQGDTVNIMLEVANFEPIATRKTARALRLQTDASKRFENDLSPTLVPYAMRELSALIMEMCPDAVFEDVVDVYPTVQQEKILTVSTDYLNKKLGTNYSVEEVERVWQRLCFAYEKNGSEFTITVPAMRLDLTGPHDFVEEVGRIIGYEKIVPVLPESIRSQDSDETFVQTQAVRAYLLASGYSEVMTYSFAKNGEIEVLASASDKKFLRTNLSDGVKASYELNKLNAPLLGLKEVKIFEIGTVFTKEKEEVHVAIADKKGIQEMTLSALYAEKKLAEHTPILHAGEAKKPFIFKPWSVFPFIVRDIALWVPEEITAEVVAKVLAENISSLVVRGPELFDSFAKEGRVSYAFRFVFQSPEKTLTDAEVEQEWQKIIARIQTQNNWTIR